MLSAAVAFLLAGFAQSVSGFGAALVAVPILAWSTGPVEAVVVVTAVSLGLTGWASVRERAHVDLAAVRLMTVGGIVGMPLGLVLLAWADERALRGLMAAVVLVALVLVVGKVRVPVGRASGRLYGVLSGTLLTSTGMNGPPLVLGLHARLPEPRRFRATLQVVLAGQDLAALTGFALVGRLHASTLTAAAVGLLCCLVGWLLGDRVFHRVRPDVFHRVIAVGLAASAVLLIAGALS